MKCSSKTYRLQMIKEVAARCEHNNDPMANYIQELLSNRTGCEESLDMNHRFNGCHYDEQAGGWISDKWGMK